MTIYAVYEKLTAKRIFLSNFLTISTAFVLSQLYPEHYEIKCETAPTQTKQR